jgi:cell division transport system permease protein
MTTFLSRIFKYGWQNFSRGKWLSVATLVIIVLALVVFESLIIFTVITKTSLSLLQEKIDISVYFKPKTAEDEMLKVKEVIEKLPETAEVEYISRDKALALFKEAHKDDAAITQALAELNENPLSPVLNIKAKKPDQYAAIAAELERESWKPITQKITYRQNQTIIDRLSKIIDITNRVGLILTVLLTLTAIIITFNTVSLAIYSNREEIGIMRLVGAPNSLISGPYMVEGIIYGVMGAVVSLLIFWPAVYWGAPYLKYFLADLDLRAYFFSHFFALVGYQLLFGIALGVISSNFAIQKYLKI